MIVMEPKEEIRQKIDVVELIGEYFPLKQAGGGSWRAVCPFHQEKTPSFYISRDKQIWHCFGCGEGGDIFEFVMKIEGVDFPEALRQLGSKAGVEVQRFISSESNEKQRMLAINLLAEKFYRKILTDTTSGAAARAYIAKRGIPPELQEAFGLGFAPEAWDVLANFLAKRGYSASEGEKAGLLLRKRQGMGIIDRFRNRIMIPLRDHQGHTVGFTGRVFIQTEKEQGPKYMNSPETAVYHKGQLLFGLDLAKPGIREKGRVVVVEGNLDVIASHKAKVREVVASSGTALTKDQLTLLKRYTNTLIFSFDADAAGLSAAKRGVKIARELGFDIRAAMLPASAGKDPDEAVQKDPAIWQEAVKKTIPITQFLIDRAVLGKDLMKIDDKRAFSHELLPEIAAISDPVEREHYLQIISDFLHTEIQVLRASLPSYLEKTAVATTKPAVSIQPKNEGFSKEEQGIRLLIGLFIHDQTWRPAIFKSLSDELIPLDSLKKLYNLAKVEYDCDTKAPNNKTFFNRLRNRLEAEQEGQEIFALFDTISIAAERFLTELPEQEVRKEIEQLIVRLKADYTKKRKSALAAAMRQAEMSGDNKKAAELLAEFSSFE